MAEQILVTAAAPFESARQVLVLPEGHPSRRMHGHSFLAKVRAALPPGWASFDGAEVDALRDHLADSIEPLNYQVLNSTLDQPTDENIARWLGARLQAPGIAQVGIQSTQHQGVDLDRDDHAHVWRRYVFDAAHQLPNVPPGHKCGRMHGHGFEVILHADQDVTGQDISIDYDQLDLLWGPIQKQLNYACLNDIPGLSNPTSEIIAEWIWGQLKSKLPALSWVTVYETASCGAQFDGEHFRIWKEFTLDSAVRMSGAPAGDARRQIHGHTFTLRLHLRAPLDKVLGWTIDFGDVKVLFDPLFKRLDHHPLHEVEGLANASTLNIARYIREQAAPLIGELDRIDLYQSRGCGVLLSWAEEGPSLPV